MHDQTLMEYINRIESKIVIPMTVFSLFSGVSAFDNCAITWGLFASRETGHSAWKEVLWK